jgi:hypothetical protein
MTSGFIHFDQTVDPSFLPRHLANCLQNVDADSVRVTENRVTFEGGIFRFVTSWNVLAAFGFGDLTVDSEAQEVRYRLSYRQLVIFIAVSIVVLAGILLVVANFSSSSLSPSLLWIPVGGIAATFLNLAVRISNFTSFLRASIDDAPRRRA